MNTTRTRAIVCHSPEGGHRKWQIEDVLVRPPEADEVLVRVIASGVCHTDLGCGSYPDGTGFPVPPYPRILGHEGMFSNRGKVGVHPSKDHY